MAGGVLTSLVVWLLARRNGIETFRLIIIGIGVRAMLVAFNTAAAAPRWRPPFLRACGTPDRLMA